METRQCAALFVTRETQTSYLARQALSTGNEEGTAVAVLTAGTGPFESNVLEYSTTDKHSPVERAAVHVAVCFCLHATLPPRLYIVL